MSLSQMASQNHTQTKVSLWFKERDMTNHLHYTMTHRHAEVKTSLTFNCNSFIIVHFILIICFGYIKDLYLRGLCFVLSVYICK